MTEEDRLKRKCQKWLKELCKSRGVWFYCPTDKFRSGIPDFIICVYGKFIWAELKSERGKVSPIQAWTHDELVHAGAHGIVARSLDEFKEFVMAFIV